MKMGGDSIDGPILLEDKSDSERYGPFWPLMLKSTFLKGEMRVFSLFTRI